LFKQNDFEQLKNYLKHRLEWEKLILKISNGFITVSAGEIDERVNSSLAKIGSFMEADRCYIFELAEDLGITLIGFARGERFNVYTHPERVTL